MEGMTIKLLEGLSLAEVKERIERGQVNNVARHTSRTYRDILRSNVFTLFNGILATLFVLILAFGSWQDALFGIVVVVNSLIGIIQEIRAKQTLDRLALLNTSQIHAIREGQVLSLRPEDIVLDDHIELAMGDQIPVDGRVISSQGLEVDESLLSGESLPVHKQEGDVVYSGSFVVAGLGAAQATHVGTQTYARRLMKEAKEFHLTHSQLMTDVNTFLRYVVWAMLAITPFLLFAQVHALGSFYAALPQTIAGLVGMVPQGLVLLTSIAFAVSIIRLGRKQVLVQELAAVENLARVDLVCFDKTGTLTSHKLAFLGLEPLAERSETKTVLQAFGHFSPPNATIQALASAFPKNDELQGEIVVPFSSQRKWSALTINHRQTWILGAPEVLLGDASSQKPLLRAIENWIEQGLRVLLLCSTQETFSSGKLPDTCAPTALVLFKEQIRPDAASAIAYFKQEQVIVKIISGDNPKTVAMVCRQVGLINVGEAVDGRTLPQDAKALAQILEQYTVFGRVSPEQKREMVLALKASGHVVAMTGDGVNDVPALKASDLGIAMGMGAPAAKAIAQVILLDNQFSTLPAIVAEGRKIIANIERVANLFLTKTVYITALAIFVALALLPFPFLPRHLTLIDAFTIGIPAFFLALASNTRRYQAGLIHRVLQFVVPAGFVAAAATFVAYGIARMQFPVESSQPTTAAFLALAMVSFWILTILAKPLTAWKYWLLAVIIGALGIVMALPFTRTFFALELPSLPLFFTMLATSAIGIVLINFLLKKTATG